MSLVDGDGLASPAVKSPNSPRLLSFIKWSLIKGLFARRYVGCARCQTNADCILDGKPSRWILAWNDGCIWCSHQPAIASSERDAISWARYKTGTLRRSAVEGEVYVKCVWKVRAPGKEMNKWKGFARKATMTMMRLIHVHIKYLSTTTTRFMSAPKWWHAERS